MLWKLIRSIFFDDVTPVKVYVEWGDKIEDEVHYPGCIISMHESILNQVSRYENGLNKWLTDEYGYNVQSTLVLTQRYEINTKYHSVRN